MVAQNLRNDEMQSGIKPKIAGVRLAKLLLVRRSVVYSIVRMIMEPRGKL